jgi:ectoine hydroxylase-related dioxygenase (phytanoyl-CoA dioxygenase family)
MNKVNQFNYPLFTLLEKLTSEQVDFFERYGFLHFKSFLNQSSVTEIIKASEDVQEKWVKENREKVNGVPIKYGSDIDGRKIVQRFAFASKFSPTLQELLQDSRFKALFPLLQSYNERVGENEKDGLVINHYINTDTSKFTKMGWHTDCLRDVFYGKKIMPMLNVGIHLDNSSPANGGLRLIPGSHKQKLLSLLFKKKYFLDHKPDKDEIGLTVQAGDLTVHDGRLWHRVALSPLKGESSRRRVMYVPVIGGDYKLKDEESPTLLYQKFSKLVK